MTNHNPLADALSVLDTDRVTDEQRAFDAAYEAALREDREMTAQAANRVKDAKKQEFLVELGRHVTGNGVTMNGDKASFDGYLVDVTRVISFWDFPVSVQVTKLDRKHQTYKPGRNGWNYAKIAEQMSYRVRQLVRHAQGEASRKANKSIVEELRRELGVLEYSSLIQASLTESLPVFFSLKIERAMTAEKAKRLLAFLREEDLVSKYEFESK